MANQIYKQKPRAHSSKPKPKPRARPAPSRVTENQRRPPLPRKPPEKPENVILVIACDKATPSTIERLYRKYVQSFYRRRPFAELQASQLVTGRQELRLLFRKSPKQTRHEFEQDWSFLYDSGLVFQHAGFSTGL